MAGQERQGFHRAEEESGEGHESAIQPPSGAAGQAQEAQAREETAGLDDLLAEIDGVLESNAEEFVRGFVQKGGQ